MPKGGKTSIFVSSTCYDLSQVRSDLRDYFASIGFDPVLSDYNNFPINPELSTINNCLENVRNTADLYVLIIGGRYGSIGPGGKSITNLEYNAAKGKGIPKYVFIKKDILSIFPIWKKNPDADLSSVVDTSQIFEFISDLYDSGDLWVFPFENAQDIINTLKDQISFLLSNCLDLKKKFSSVEHDLSSLQGAALKLAVEQPDYWEFLLLAQLMNDNFEKCKYKRLDAELGIVFGDPIELDGFSDVTSWVCSRISSILNTIDSLMKAINNGYVKAVGEPGEPGDITRIIHFASRFQDAYEHVLDWRLQFEKVKVDDEFQKLIEFSANFTLNTIEEIETFVSGLSKSINETIKKAIDSNEMVVLEYSLVLTAPDISDFSNEMTKLNEKYIPK